MHAMDRRFAIIGAVGGLLAMLLGSFGAHGLEEVLSEEHRQEGMKTFEVAVRYQMYHALALFGAAWFTHRFNGRLPEVAGWSFVAGTILFSGSLYVLTFQKVGWVGILAPVGGIMLMAGWGMLAAAAVRGRGS